MMAGSRQVGPLHGNELKLSIASSRGNEDYKPQRSSLLRAKLPKIFIPKLSFKRSKDSNSLPHINSNLQSGHGGDEDLPPAARRMNFRSIDFRRMSFSRGVQHGATIEPRASRSSASRPATPATASSGQEVELDSFKREVSPGSLGSFSLPPIPPIPALQRTYSGRRSLFPITSTSVPSAELSQHAWSPAARQVEIRMPTSTSTNATTDPRSAESSGAHNYSSVDTNITTPSSGRPSKVSFVLRPGIIPSSSTESYSSLLSHFPILKRRSNSKVDETRKNIASTPSSSREEGSSLSQVPSAPARLQLGDMCSRGLAEAQAAIFSRREQRKSRLMSRNPVGTPVSILRRRSYTVESQPRYAHPSSTACSVGSNCAVGSTHPQDYASAWGPFDQASSACYFAGTSSDLAYEHAHFDVFPLGQQHATNQRLQYAMGNFTWDEAVRHRQSATIRESVIGPRSEAPTGLAAVAEDEPFIFGSKRNVSEQNEPEEAVDEDDEALLSYRQSITRAIPTEVNIVAKNGTSRASALATTGRGQFDPLPTTVQRTLAPQYEPLPHPGNYVDESSSEYETAAGDCTDSSSSTSSWRSESSSTQSETGQDETADILQRNRHCLHARAAAFEKLVTSRPGASSKAAVGTYGRARMEMFRTEAVSGSSSCAPFALGK